MNKFDMAIWGEPVLVQTNPPELSEAPEQFPVQFPDKMTIRQLGNGGIAISTGGSNVEFGKAKPLNKGGLLMVPMRPLFEALGARVTYNPISHQIAATRGEQIITMIMGAKTATINGRQTELDVPPSILFDETMVPLRFVAESLGVAVEYKR